MKIMDGVILKSESNEIVKRIRRRARRFSILVGIVAFTLALVLSPLISTESINDKTYQKVRILDTVLRDKILSVGEAVSIANILIEKTGPTVPLPLVLAIIEVESQFTITCQSFRGCRGLMQLSPVVLKIYLGDTAFKDFKNAYNPVLNLTVGIRYLEDLYKAFDGDLDKILRHYHSGDSTAKASGIYVKTVLKRAEVYRMVIFNPQAGYGTRK